MDRRSFMAAGLAADLMAYDDRSPSYSRGNGNLLPDPTQWITHSLLSLVDKDEAQRKIRMKRAWDAYHGQLPPQVTRQWKPGDRHRPPDDNVQINNPRLIVNRGVEFLAGKDYEVEYDTADEATGVEPSSAADESSVEDEALEAFWASVGGRLTFQKAAQNGGVTGHVFGKLTEPASTGEVAGFEIVDPSNVDVIWNPDSHLDVWEYRISWTHVDLETKQPVARRERHVKDDRESEDSTWTIIDEERRDGDDVWREIATSPWPYPFSAVVACQNLPCANEYWGISDLEPDIIDLCEALNGSASNLRRLIRLHAHRHWWATGVKSDDKFDLAPDTLIRLTDPNAKMGALEVISDLSGALDFYRELKQSLYEVSSVPPVAVGKLESIGQLSGLALGILYGPLIAKTETKQGTYGAWLTAVSEHALYLAGHQDAAVVVHWPELVPADPIAEREALILDEQLGVSRDTILEKLGYDPQLEREKRAVDQAEQLAQAQAQFDAGAQVDPSVQQPPRVAGG